MLALLETFMEMVFSWNYFQLTISEFIISLWKKLNKFCDIAKFFFDNIHASAYPIFSSQEIEHSPYSVSGHSFDPFEIALDLKFALQFMSE